MKRLVLIAVVAAFLSLTLAPVAQAWAPYSGVTHFKVVKDAHYYRDLLPPLSW